MEHRQTSVIVLEKLKGGTEMETKRTLARFFLERRDPYQEADKLHGRGCSAAEIFSYFLSWEITNLGYVCILLWKHYHNRIGDLLLGLLAVVEESSVVERLKKCLRALQHAYLGVVLDSAGEIVSTLLQEKFPTAEICEAMLAVEPKLASTNLGQAGFIYLAHTSGLQTAVSAFRSKGVSEKEIINYCLACGVTDAGAIGVLLLNHTKNTTRLVAAIQKALIPRGQ